MDLKIAVNGAAGRMGKTVISVLAEDEGSQLVSATEAAGHPQIGTDAGMAAQVGKMGIKITAEIQGEPDVLVDFSTPEAAVHRAMQCAQMGIAMVVGTTGIGADPLEKMKSQIATRVPLLISPNMSVGVNLLFTVAEQIAPAVGGEWNIEIVEVHHNKKKDSPSGTALRLAEVMCNALGWQPSEVLCHGRQGSVGHRPRKQIGIHAVRAGNIVGDHTILLAGPGETIELTHRAASRHVFAYGALRAGKFIAHKAAGLYTMKDVLS